MTLDAGIIVQGLIGMALVGLVADHFRLKDDLAKFKLHVAQDYASKNDMLGVKLAVEKVDGRVETMLEMLYAIKGQVGAWQKHDAA